MPRFLKYYSRLTGAVFGFLIPLPVLAQADPLNIQQLKIFQLPTGGAGKLANIIIDIINILLGLAAVLAVAAIIWGAVMFITSLGNEQRVASAKKIIFWAIAGLLIIGFSFAIIQLIGGALGVAGVNP